MKPASIRNRFGVVCGPKGVSVMTGRQPCSAGSLVVVTGSVVLWFCTMAAVHAQVVTKYSYDAGDHVNQVTDSRGLLTTYVYDGLDQKWQQSSPDTGMTSFIHDSYGRLASVTRADGGQTTYGYDALNRPISISAGGLTQTFTYDTCTHGLGRLCLVTDATGATSYTYTPEGWLSGRGFSIGGTAYSLGYGYNALGQTTSVVYPDGNQALYTYTFGVVSAVQFSIGGAVSNVATGISYQPNDSAMTQWMSGNGLVNTLNYDADGRLTGIAVPGVQALGVSYDAANRINGIANGIDGGMAQSFGYDAMSRLTSVYSGIDNEAFQYDANGNRISQTLNGVFATVTPNTTNNQIMGLSGGSNVTYGYDAKGNLITVSGTPTFTYDPFNRLTSTSGATYYINPEGQRLRKTASGISTYFAPDRAGPLMAESQGGGWSDYVWLNGRLIARVNAGQILAIHDDQVGRPEVMTDSSKVIVWRARNFAFDRTVMVANTLPLNLGFPGQYYDAESGLWNNGFRDYSPSLGRYIESDPIGLFAGTNTYAYVGGNPLSRIDPLGLQEEGTEESRFEEVEAMFPKIGPNQVRPLSIVEEQKRDGTCRAPNAPNPFSKYDTSITSPGSQYTNVSTDVTASEFVANLAANGYTISSQGSNANGPYTVLSNGPFTYTVYTRSSTGAEGAQLFGPGGYSVKFSLGASH